MGKLRIGRNNPCPCGSGRKYKKCCGGDQTNHGETTGSSAAGPYYYLSHVAPSDQLPVLRDLVRRGYLVQAIFAISSITQSLGGDFFATFVGFDQFRSTIFDPDNAEKKVILLIDESANDRPVFLTDNEDVIEYARVEKERQDELIDIDIHAVCIALGGLDYTDRRFFDIEQFVESIDQKWGWRFRPGEREGEFFGEFHLDTYDPILAEQKVAELQVILDIIAVGKGIGFQVQHHSFSSHHRMTRPSIGAMSQTSRRLPILSSSNIGATRFLLEHPDPELERAFRGINQSYIENCLPSRLSMLWATAEELFGGKPRPLLSDDEIRSLLTAVDQIESIKEDKRKYDRITTILKDPQYISEKSRNEMIAESIAKYLPLPKEDIVREVKQASSIRGKNVHQIRKDWSEIKESEKFLRSAIIAFLNSKTKELVAQRP